MGDIREVIGDAHARGIYTYTLPSTLANGVKSIGLRVLTAEEELRASKAGRFDLNRINYEAVKLSIAEFDGKAIGNAEGEIDKFWNRVDPKVRSLLLQAYNKLTSPSLEETASFFGSEVIKV